MAKTLTKSCWLQKSDRVCCYKTWCLQYEKP